MRRRGPGVLNRPSGLPEACPPFPLVELRRQHGGPEHANQNVGDAQECQSRRSHGDGNEVHGVDPGAGEHGGPRRQTLPHHPNGEHCDPTHRQDGDRSAYHGDGGAVDGVSEPRGPRADNAGRYPEGADRGRGHAPQRGGANTARPGEEEHNSSDDAEQCPDSQRRQDGQKALRDIRDPSLGLLCLGVSGLTGARVAVIGRRSVVMAGVGGRRHGRHGLHCGGPSGIVRQSTWGSSSHAARMVWLHGTRRRADAVSAAAVVPGVALSRVIGCERATYPTNAAGGVVRQACGAKGGAPAGRDPCPHLEPT